MKFRQNHPKVKRKKGLAFKNSFIVTMVKKEVKHPFKPCLDVGIILMGSINVNKQFTAQTACALSGRSSN